MGSISLFFNTIILHRDGDQLNIHSHTMPPKRKALAESSSNKDAATKPRNAKAAKTSAKSDASKKSAAKAPEKVTPKGSSAKDDTPAAEKSSNKSKVQAVKYSNANTVRPSYL